MALVPKVEKIARNFRQLQRVALGIILERNLVIADLHARKASTMGKKIWESTHSRNFDNHVTVRPNRYDISTIKRVTSKFLEVSRCGRAKQRQRNVQKSLLHVQSCFLLIRLIVVFLPFSLPSPPNITLFYILFEKTISVIESFAFSPG